MGKRWKIVLPGVAFLLALSLVGCGGDEGAPSVKEYEAAVVKNRDRVDLALARIPQAKSPDDFLDRLDEAGDSIEAAAKDLNEVGAPPDFQDENKRLVRHLRELSASLHGTAAQARESGFDELLAGANGLNFDSWDKANAILRTLRQQGLDVKPLVRH